MKRNAPPLLSVTDAAPVIGVSRRTAYSLIRSHEIPHVRVGGRIKVPVVALDRWLSERADEAMASVRQEPAP